MPTCLDMPPEKWEEARQKLVYSFSRRYGRDNASDLAHDTLAAILSRTDYQFEREEDFLRVVRAFARNVVMAAQRKNPQYVAALDAELAPEPSVNSFGLNPTEMAVLLDQVARKAEATLSERERTVWEGSEEEDRDSLAKSLGLRDAIHFGVVLHRARRKIATILGAKIHGPKNPGKDKAGK